MTSWWKLAILGSFTGFRYCCCGQQVSSVEWPLWLSYLQVRFKKKWLHNSKPWNWLLTYHWPTDRFNSPGLLPKYRCLVPECELPSNASYSYQSLTADFGQPDFVQATILSLGLGDHTCMRKVLKQEDPHTSCAKFVSLIEHNPQNVKGMILSNKEGYF